MVVENVKIEAGEQINRFQEFLQSHYYDKIVENLRKEEGAVVVDFVELAKADIDLANELLDEPENTIKAAELAVGQFDLDNITGFKVRFKNISKSCEQLIGNIRTKHLGRLISFEGYLLRKSKVLPKTTSCSFECPVCANLVTVLQLGEEIKEPMKCGCGRKGKFILISKELVDVQSLVVQEKQESLSGSEQPQSIHVMLKDDLVSPLKERRMNPGANIKVVGVLKEIPIFLRTGAKSTSFDLMIEANHVEVTSETFDEIIVTEDEKKIVHEISKQNPLKLMVRAIAPTIYGHDKLKEAIVLQLFGGVKKTLEDGRIVRGDSHILIIGDPGSGKTALMRFLTNIAPKWQYISGGGGTSAVGISAAVVRDEILKTWTLDAGAAVLANNGVLFFDELDKLRDEDRWAIHEVMESQSFTVHKAGINATLMAKVTILAAANPKLGRFDNYAPLYEQLELESTLINRFDLIFPLKDIPDPVRDKALSEHILKSHRKKLMLKTKDPNNPFVDKTFTKKYIAYAKKNIFPELTDEAEKEILEFYAKLRSQGYGTEDGRAKAIPINARYLEGIIRLTESCAKVRLSKTAAKQDAVKAIQIVDHCLRQFGFDHETGKYDIDMIETGVSASKKQKYSIIKEIITELQEKVGKLVPVDDVVMLGIDKGFGEDEVNNLIYKLKETGDIYEPKPGFITMSSA